MGTTFEVWVYDNSLGKSVGYNYLLRRLQNMWKPEGHMELIDLEEEYYLAKFELQKDYDYAKFEGPWMVLDHYVLVQEWRPNFDPLTDKTEKLLVWVRFPSLSIEYFDDDFLRKIGNKVGRPIKIDNTTSIATRRKFARICVEVDISKPLLSKFTVEDKVCLIEYEGIHMVCFKCGVFGHRKDNCGQSMSTANRADGEQGEDAMATNATRDREELPALVKKTSTRGDLTKESYGQWMLVTRKEKRPAKENQKRPTTR
ncbi:uncharacterized protein LOC116016010 [Ipomoea triloba]|uniref:uncharacterized protein LOC116016010 n=1 Tax=Ipomoea triloba TaxID=35885 RepID=UPI00125E4BEB|nr:uncharacterized protein LOC116016010 [Ipomoea triloba]